MYETGQARVKPPPIKFLPNKNVARSDAGHHQRQQPERLSCRVPRLRSLDLSPYYLSELGELVGELESLSLVVESLPLPVVPVPIVLEPVASVPPFVTPDVPWSVVLPVLLPMLPGWLSFCVPGWLPVSGVIG